MTRKALALVLAAICPTAWAEEAPPPIIDVHLHALPADHQGPPPLALCAPAVGYPPVERGSDWPEAFMAVQKDPPCEDPVWSPETDEAVMEQTLAILERHNIVGITSGPLVEQWHARAPERIIPGLMFELNEDTPSPEAVRAMFESGRYAVLGEVIIQYQGLAPGDPAFEPYLALAEELDIPVGIHIGTGPPGAPYLGFDGYRARLHSPLLLEEVLVRHPDLRVYVMHAGWPMLDDLLALMWAHPQVYVGTGVIAWALPRAEFHRYLRRIVEAGFGKRVMFGSDQMVWPRAIERAIEAIETAEFLTEEQKRDLLCGNAARFLRLDQEHKGLESIWDIHGLDWISKVRSRTVWNRVGTSMP